MFSAMSEYGPLIAAVIAPHLGGLAGAFITKREVPEWYETLRKPDWRPPNWMFGPVWGTLYTSMGVASYLVWRDGGGFSGDAKLPLALYGTQLALNWAWTPIFFGAHKKGMALVDIIALWGTIGGCIYTFWSINHKASYLMIPYIAWVTLASALNYCIWRDNRDKKD
ncbi:translocator protein-like isoform X1 [Limulus polyphemus]|uniref:Translocator protein-like isoform X1 n=1 Tax=Limulus polyphemus TaxID=6850 RepID=A0ABM1S2N3_LIMPO|nr:translocator protein-like isoform X1 [Limulus polyphemus]